MSTSDHSYHFLLLPPPSLHETTDMKSKILKFLLVCLACLFIVAGLVYLFQLF